jgi:hypothetical protein
VVGFVSYELPGKLTSKNLGRSIVVNLTNIINPINDERDSVQRQQAEAELRLCGA